jgi:hypothetical protein
MNIPLRTRNFGFLHRLGYERCLGCYRPSAADFLITPRRDEEQPDEGNENDDDESSQSRNGPERESRPAFHSLIITYPGGGTSTVGRALWVDDEQTGDYSVRKEQPTI